MLVAGQENSERALTFPKRHPLFVGASDGALRDKLMTMLGGRAEGHCLAVSRLIPPAERTDMPPSRPQTCHLLFVGMSDHVLRDKLMTMLMAGQDNFA